MNAEHVRDFGRILRRNEIQFVIVGGAAVRHFVPSESQDVDALLLAKEYRRAVRAFDKDPAVVSFSDEAGEMATGHFHSRFRLVRFDLLNPGAFSGSRSGDEFFLYVARHGSVPTPDGRVARVPIVWYMRLVIEGEAWQAQVSKILRDLRAGAPWLQIGAVRRIAHRFDTAERISQRLPIVADAALRLGLLGGKRVDSVESD